MLIEQIFIAPGHSYLGHPAGQPGPHAMRALQDVECVAGRGLRGDRYFDFRENFKGQVTFFAREAFVAACEQSGNLDCPPTTMRRNVLTSGIDLNALIGVEFEMQGLRFFGSEECAPCHWMDWAIGPGAKESLRGQGGLRARILTSGMLSTGNPRLRLSPG